MESTMDSEEPEPDGILQLHPDWAEIQEEYVKRMQ